MQAAKSVRAESAERVVAAERWQEEERHALGFVEVGRRQPDASREHAALGEEADELAQLEIDAGEIQAAVAADCRSG